jgi:oligopeptide/dipeptide ABC transporter ATP-binding protein
LTGRLLSVENLKTYFYTSAGVVKAVDDVTLEVGEKEAVALVGESGGGKSVTALSILRLVPFPAKIVGGKVFFRDRNLLELSESEIRKIRGREIGMIFQDPMTFMNPVMKVKDQIAEVFLTHQTLSKKEVEANVIGALEKVHIPDPKKVMNYYPHQLSGGMLQRCIIAMAIGLSPVLLIADEPTTALDTTTQLQILSLLKELTKLTSSFVLVTHDLGIVADTCDRVYIMYGGKIVEHGDVFTIFENPCHPYTQGLLRSVLSIDECKKELFGIDGNPPDPLNPPTGCRFHPRCNMAKPRCHEQIPPTDEVEKGHKVCCWLYGS